MLRSYPRASGCFSESDVQTVLEIYVDLLYKPQLTHDMI